MFQARVRSIAAASIVFLAMTCSALADSHVRPPDTSVDEQPNAQTHPQSGTEPSHTKLLAASTVALVHVGYATWSYFAWYRDHDMKQFDFEHGPWFDVTQYSGGADKLGHLWSNYTLTRATTALLVAGGWRRWPSSLVSAGLTEVAFTLTEIEDGYVYGFDAKDMLFNVAGAAFGVVMENVPALDRWLDLRLQYFPSADFRRTFRETGSVDVGQDYSGQTYLLALHFGAIPGFAASDWGYWSKFVDLTVGFEARNYLPVPEPASGAPRQTLFVGLGVNMQGLLEHLLPDSRGRRLGHGVFEVFSLPLTTFRYLETSRHSEVMGAAGR